MTREAGVAYNSIKYELCILKAEYTNLDNNNNTSIWLALACGQLHVQWSTIRGT